MQKASVARAAEGGVRAWPTRARGAILVLAWGSAFAPLSICLRYISPIPLAGWRSLVGGVLMAFLAWLSGRPIGWRRSWRLYLGLSALNVVGFQGLQVLALESAPSGPVAVLIYLQPLVASILARLFLGEELGRTKMGALLLALVGVSFAATLTPSAGGVTLSSAVLAVGAATFWGAGTVLLKRAVGDADPLWSVGLPLLIGGGVLLVASVPRGSVPIHPDGLAVWCFGCVVVLGTVAPWVIWVRLLGAADVSVVTARTYFVPVVAMALGAWLLKEPVSPGQLLGVSCVVLAVRAALRPRSGSGHGGPRPDLQFRGDTQAAGTLTEGAPQFGWLR